MRFWYNYLNLGLLLIIWVSIGKNFKRQITERRLWVFFFALYTITEFVGVPLDEYGINNLWLYNISKPIQFVLLVLYLIKVAAIRRPLNLIIKLITTGCCIVFLLSTPSKEFSSFPDIVFGSIIMIFCVYYFYQLISYQEYVPLNVSEFWYCVSLFVYFGANLCINGSLNFLLQKQPAVAHKLFYFMVANSVIFYLLIVYAILGFRKNYLKQTNG